MIKQQRHIQSLGEVAARKLGVTECSSVCDVNNDSALRVYMGSSSLNDRPNGLQIIGDKFSKHSSRVFK